MIRKNNILKTFSAQFLLYIEKIYMKVCLPISLLLLKQQPVGAKIQQLSMHTKVIPSNFYLFYLFTSAFYLLLICFCIKIIFIMRINKQKIPNMSNKSPITTKQHKINSQKGVQGLVADIFKFNLSYQSMPMTQHCAKSLAPLEATLYKLFFLFITSSHCEIIAKHTNYKA